MKTTYQSGYLFKTKEKSLFLDPLVVGSHLAIIFVLLLWFMPATHAYCERFDSWIFYTLNGSLTQDSLWQKLWGILNHKREVLLNLVFAAIFSVWGILATDNRKLKSQRIKQTIYFWICFQIGFMLQDYFFNHYLQVLRASPSLVLEPAVKLSEVLQNTNIKDASQKSFPGGHAFSIIYWASFTLLCAPKRIAYLGFFISLFLCVPRLFSGAHWFSDVLFSGLLALVWLSWTISTPIYKMIKPN